MTTQEILKLDCRKKDEKKKLLAALGEVKPLQKFKDAGFPVDDIQETMIKIQERYEVEMQYMIFLVQEKYNNYYWSASVRGSKDGKWFGNVYALTTWELLAKIVIYMHSLIKQGKVDKR